MLGKSKSSRIKAFLVYLLIICVKVVRATGQNRHQSLADLTVQEDQSLNRQYPHYIHVPEDPINKDLDTTIVGGSETDLLCFFTMM